MIRRVIVKPGLKRAVAGEKSATGHNECHLGVPVKLSRTELTVKELKLGSIGQIGWYRGINDSRPLRDESLICIIKKLKNKTK
jgi:hypothetical protein